MQGGGVTCANQKFHVRVENEKGIGSKRDTKRMFVGSAVAKIDGSVVKSIVVDESVFQPHFGFGPFASPHN